MFDGSSFRFALARYNRNGSLDRSFGGDGKVATHFAKKSREGAESVAIQADGKIVAAGDTYQSHDRFALARYNPNGSLDCSFGGDGKVATHFASMSDDNADSVAIQADGKVVAGGETFQSHDRFALARYKPNGSLDRSFGGDGKVATHFAN